MLVVVATSARMLAQSARRGGLRPVALDVFGDLDTRQAAHWVSIAHGRRKGIDPERLYRVLCVRQRIVVDRCLLYTCRCAVYYASTPESKRDPSKLRWWAWKDDAATVKAMRNKYRNSNRAGQQRSLAADDRDGDDEDEVPLDRREQTTQDQPDERVQVQRHAGDEKQAQRSDRGQRHGARRRHPGW